MASRMEQEVARLQAKHRVPLPQPEPLPLLDQIDGPVIVTGLASTPDLDFARCMVAPYALSWPTDPLPPLLFRHGEPAGHVKELSFDDRGRLRVTAYVDHSEAKRAPAFSVGFALVKFEIVDAESSVGFRCHVQKGILTEISMTATPCNRHALVQSRVRAMTGFDDALAGLRRMQKHLDDLAGKTAQAPAPAPTPPSPKPYLSLGAGPAFIIGSLPAAILNPKRNSFRDVVALAPRRLNNANASASPTSAIRHVALPDENESDYRHQRRIVLGRQFARPDRVAGICEYPPQSAK